MYTDAAPELSLWCFLLLLVLNKLLTQGHLDVDGPVGGQSGFESQAGQGFWTQELTLEVKKYCTGLLISIQLLSVPLLTYTFNVAHFPFSVLQNRPLIIHTLSNNTR